MQIINHLPTNYKDIEDNYSNEFKIDDNGKIALTDPVPIFTPTQFELENNILSIKPEALSKTNVVYKPIVNNTAPTPSIGCFNVYQPSGSIEITLPTSPAEGDELEIFISDQSVNQEIMKGYNIWFRSTDYDIRIAGDNCSLSRVIAANTKNALVGFKYAGGIEEGVWIASGNCGLGGR